MKAKRKVLPILDLSAMADVAWLLLIFLMLRGKTKRMDQRAMDLPESSMVMHGSAGALRVVMEPSGRCWLYIDPGNRAEVLAILEARAGAPMPVANRAAFLSNPMIGTAPQAFFAGKEEIEQHAKQGFRDFGQLVAWIKLLTESSHAAAWSIYADQNTPYFAINEIFSVFSGQGVNRFSLVTNLDRGE